MNSPGTSSLFRQMRLEGRVAAVTGAAMGIGEAIATELAALGAKVAVVDVNAHNAERVAHRLNQAAQLALPVTCDVSQLDQVEAGARGIVQTWGGLDILVNCAAVASASGQPYTQCTAPDWRRTLDINLMGAVHWCGAVRESLTASQAGRIVNIASITGVISAPYMPAYSVSKAALISLSKVLARDLATSHVTVNAVCPGYVRTPMWGELTSRLDAAKDAGGDVFDQRVRQHVPMQRPQSVEDVAACVAFLCSDLACNITGQVIGVDGGVTI
jgi:NAD(P)-dependent dehydrogenase (short-subunit alcohol dehydrogenase family)